MKIEFEKNLIYLVPENSTETQSVERLWCVLIDCTRETRKLAPIGEYIPSKKNSACFVVEGLKQETTPEPKTLRVDHDTCVCCFICNKMHTLKKGDGIPVCCGKPMDVVD